MRGTRVEVFRVSRGHKRREKSLALLQWRTWDRRDAFLDGDAQAVQTFGGKFRRDVRPTERPAAAHGHVHAQAKLVRRARRGTDRGKKFRREVAKIHQAFAGIVKREGIDRLDFKSTDAGIFHLVQFPIEFFAWSPPAQTTTSAP